MNLEDYYLEGNWRGKVLEERNVQYNYSML